MRLHVTTILHTGLDLFESAIAADIPPGAPTEFCRYDSYVTIKPPHVESMTPKIYWILNPNYIPFMKLRFFKAPHPKGDELVLVVTDVDDKIFMTSYTPIEMVPGHMDHLTVSSTGVVSIVTYGGEDKLHDNERTRTDKSK